MTSADLTTNVAQASTADKLKDVPSPSSRSTRRWSKAAIGISAWVIGFIFIIPILYMLLTSLHPPAKAQTYPPSWTAPLTLENYRALFQPPNSIAAPLINSAICSIVSTLLVLAVAIPAAYALSIRRVPRWSDAMFFFLSTKMLPPVAGILPIYLFTNKVIHLPDSVLVLIVLYTSMNLPIAVWMMRSFLDEVPTPIIEAAQIDGASTFTILTRIVGPIALPGIAATSLICFIFAWNEQLFAKVLTSVVAQTGPVFVGTLIQTEHAYLAQLCAGAVLVSIPVLVAGFAAQDKLVQGLSLGAVK